jgi:hypothetical protein
MNVFHHEIDFSLMKRLMRVKQNSGRMCDGKNGSPPLLWLGPARPVRAWARGHSLVRAYRIASIGVPVSLLTALCTSSRRTFTARLSSSLYFLRNSLKLSRSLRSSLE